MEFDKTPPTPAPAPTDQSASEQLVGEGKTFKTIDDLAKGKIEADAFIEQLKAEAANMRTKIGEAEQESLKGSTIQQVLEAVRKMSENGSPNEPAPPGEELLDGNQSGLSKEDILQLMERTLKQNETVKTQLDNFTSVHDAFLKAFTDPDKARLSYKAAAESLGMSEEQLDDFARMNPKLVLRAAGLEQAFKSTQTPPSYLGNEHNSEAQREIVEGAKDNSWWEDQRKSKGNAWYFQPKVQQAYWKDVKSLGDNFLKD